MRKKIINEKKLNKTWKNINREKITEEETNKELERERER